MSAMNEFLAERATRLAQMDRAEVYEDIVAKVNEEDPDSNVVWADRLAAYDPGEIEAFAVDNEVMGQLRVEYGPE